jgi:hypothetical protein
MDEWDVLGLAGITAADKAVASHDNVILFDNFIAQAKAARVLMPRKGATEPTMGHYNALYDCLVKAGVIEKSGGVFTLVTTGRRNYHVTKDAAKLAPRGIKAALDRGGGPDFAAIAKQYAINFGALSKMLKNYTFSAMDEVGMFSKHQGQTRRGGRSRRARRRCRRSRRR